MNENEVLIFTPVMERLFTEKFPGINHRSLRKAFRDGWVAALKWSNEKSASKTSANNDLPAGKTPAQICPKCKSELLRKERESGKCWNCGEYINTGKLR